MKLSLDRDSNLNDAMFVAPVVLISFVGWVWQIDSLFWLAIPFLMFWSDFLPPVPGRQSERVQSAMTE
jgi:hypothetical protein